MTRDRHGSSHSQSHKWLPSGTLIGPTFLLNVEEAAGRSRAIWGSALHRSVRTASPPLNISAGAETQPTK